ncbi:MAG: response regulator transcription factor [Candidatus Dormiibacterota bacterium]|jgi:DNA-binding NarL/FixJ family response regulator
MRVILADDSVLLREGLARMLADSGFQVAAQVGDAAALLAAVDADPPDVCIVDIRMPPTNTTEGLEAALQLRVRHPSVAVLVLSQYVETRYAMELLARGADGVGYLLKDRVGDVSELLAAIRSVAAGRSVIDPTVVSRLVGRRRQVDPMETLSAREREVLSLMAEGRSNRAIGERMFLSPKTVETHVSAVFSKLGIEDTADDNRRVLSVLTWLRDGGSAA